MIKRYHISGDGFDGFYTFAYRKVKMINIYKGYGKRPKPVTPVTATALSYYRGGQWGQLGHFYTFACTKNKIKDIYKRKYKKPSNPPQLPP